MDPIIGGALIGAGSQLLGGLLGRSSQDKARDAAAAQNDANLAMQKEFAQQGIRWRVADAKAAGIHPLYAMGASIPTFSPNPVSTFDGDPMASAVSGMGQNIGRAVAATKTQEERDTVNSKALFQLSLERGQLQNDLLREQINQLRSPASPPFPSSHPNMIDGQGDTPKRGLVTPKPMELTTTRTGEPHMEPAANPDVGWLRTGSGWAVTPSKAAKESIEDDFLSELAWNVRNRLPQTLFQGNLRPPREMIEHLKKNPDLEVWFHPGLQEYRYRKKATSDVPDHWSAGGYVAP